tara:strand:+ start:2631 stop:3557 length:927 start_codon:yes stop_codon:yes gene_type:complete
MSEKLKEIIKEHVHVIKNTSLFHGLSIEKLVKILVNCQHTEIKAGDIIFKEGEPSLSMAIVLTGQVEIFKGKSRVCFLEPPVLIGEIGLFAEELRNATVKAAYDAISLSLTQKHLNTIILKDPETGQRIFRNIILSLRNKINNDNQQILSLQGDLSSREKEVLKLKASLKEKEDLKKTKPATEEKKDILPANKRLSKNSRKSIRVSITNQKHCYIKIKKTTVIVKDLSLGGVSLELSTVRREIEKKWVEGVVVQGEIFFQGHNSFPFSGVIRSMFPTSCGIQFDKLTYSQETLISNAVNDLQRLSQVV